MSVYLLQQWYQKAEVLIGGLRIIHWISSKTVPRSTGLAKQLNSYGYGIAFHSEQPFTDKYNWIEKKHHKDLLRTTQSENLKPPNPLGLSSL